MNIDKQVREVLEKMVYADIEVDKHFLIDTIIGQTIFKIHALYLAKFEKMLPKEESQSVLEKLEDVEDRNVIWKNGRIAGKNQCLTEIKSKMNKDRK